MGETRPQRATPSTGLRAGRWVVLLVLVLIPSPTQASSDSDSLIVPSKGIGLFQLGMTQAEIHAIRRAAPCDVQVLYSNGKASRLETNCGGAYRTAEYVQVGIGPSRVLSMYGLPDRVTSSDYANIRGEWMHYNGGIAFRVIYGEGPGNALIQAIAVFYGIGPMIVRRQPDVPTSPAPPGGVGE